MAGEFGKYWWIPQTSNKRDKTCVNVVNNGDLTNPTKELIISKMAKVWMIVVVLLVFSKTYGWPTVVAKKTVLNKTIDHKDAEIELYAIKYLFGWAMFMGEGEYSVNKEKSKNLKIFLCMCIFFFFLSLVCSRLMSVFSFAMFLIFEQSYNYRGIGTQVYTIP